LIGIWSRQKVVQLLSKEVVQGIEAIKIIGQLARNLLIKDA
jgi:hypothetical protein